MPKPILEPSEMDVSHGDGRRAFVDGAPSKPKVNGIPLSQLSTLEQWAFDLGYREAEFVEREKKEAKQCKK